MSETARTLTFAAVAALSLGVAWVAKPPDNLTPAEMSSAKLGQLFWPDFSNPTAPTSIRVVNWDEQKAASRIFAVELKDGLWRIPSHHNYPADAVDRLAKTSTSLMGVKRDQYMPGSESRHEEFGVVDPLESDITKLKGRGQRITLSKGDEPLLDLIIGKPVKDRQGQRYLRRPDEKAVYVAQINPDLSTKFSDWVETNLLKTTRDELSSIEIDNYAIVEGADRRGRVQPGEINRLSRDKSSDPWKLDGLDDPAKEVDTTKVNDLVGTLTDLKLTGIRPKPPGLTAELEIDKKLVKNQNQLDYLVAEMASRGFIPSAGRNQDDPDRLLSKQGELRLTTSKGLAYTLRMGDVFTGGELEVEAGGEGEQKTDEKTEDGDDTPAAQSSRYLLVTVAFDESLLGPKPVKPEAPPEEAADEENSDAADDAAKKAREELKSKYQAELLKYEADEKDWTSKEKSGKEKAEELNRRFGEWYYVISSDIVSKLRLSHEELIRDKKADSTGGQGGLGAPGSPLGQPPGGANLEDLLKHAGEGTEPADDTPTGENDSEANQPTSPGDDAAEPETKPDAGEKDELQPEPPSEP